MLKNLKTGNILILIILCVTIPRWAMTLQQIDTFQIRGIPLAAIGEAIILELGCLYVLAQYTRCLSHDLRYHAQWEVQHKANQEKGRNTRKPEHDPRIAGFRLLPVLLLLLEGLTIAAQTPFIAAQMLDTTAAALLSDWGPIAVWAYALVLVISPGVMTIAIGFALHYEKVLQAIAAEADKPDTAQEQAGLVRLFDGLLARLPGQAGRIAQPVQTVRVSAADKPDASRADGADVSGQADECARFAQPDPEKAAHKRLLALRMALAEKAERESSGNGHIFNRSDVQELLEMSASGAKSVLAYGRQIGAVAFDGRHTYELKEGVLCQG